MDAKADLRRIALWADALSEDEAARAWQGIAERRFRAGTYICHRGDRLDYWTGVVAGLVQAGMVSENGRPIAFTCVGPGGWFGEGAVLKNEARRYDLRALRDTRLAMMDRCTFMWLFETSAGFMRFLVHHLNDRIGQFVGALESSRLHHPTARVARTLAQLFNPVLVADNHLKMTQDELAQLVGVSRQKANRALLRLQADGFLTIGRGGISIVDAEALAGYKD